MTSSEQLADSTQKPSRSNWQRRDSDRDTRPSSRTGRDTAPNNRNLPPRMRKGEDGGAREQVRARDSSDNLTSEVVRSPPKFTFKKKSSPEKETAQQDQSQAAHAVRSFHLITTATPTTATCGVCSACYTMHFQICLKRSIRFYFNRATVLQSFTTPYNFVCGFCTLIHILTNLHLRTHWIVATCEVHGTCVVLLFDEWMFVFAGQK